MRAANDIRDQTSGVFMGSMPMVDGILTIDVARDRDHGDDEKPVSRKKIPKGKPQEPMLVQLLGIHGQNNHDGDERQHAGQHLPLCVPPIRLSLLALNHCCNSNLCRLTSDLNRTVPLTLRPE